MGDKAKTKGDTETKQLKGRTKETGRTKGAIQPTKPLHSKEEMKEATYVQ
jgi:hypothetical protein